MEDVDFGFHKAVEMLEMRATHKFVIYYRIIGC